MNSLIQYYKIGSPKIGMVDWTLIIKFEIPLVGRAKFLVIKIAPALIKKGKGLFSMLVPSHDIVALAEDGKSFAMLKEGELNHCVKIPG